mmetsp:Transcript_160209/g.283811  ORF Transcript_160209/g.283811 Transcript_160209/m.283811 type:complete len:589 (-) Transcript_160209:77-1843(-)
MEREMRKMMMALGAGAIAGISIGALMWRRRLSEAAAAAPRRSRWRRAQPAPSDAVSGNASSVPAQAPSPSEGSRAADGSASGASWIFVYGANVDSSKQLRKRKIKPLEEAAGRLRGFRLVFNHSGGTGNIERLGDNSDSGPDAVHGMLLLLTLQDFSRLSTQQNEYTTQEIMADTYDGRSINAHAFVTAADFRLGTYPAPPRGYLKLVQEAAATSSLDAHYCAWLQSLPFFKGERTAEYWAAAATLSKSRGQASGGDGDQRRHDVERDKANPLRLAACRQFLVPGEVTLVDIGANMAKCQPQDLAQQLTRAVAAGVSHLVLTGVSVKGSEESQRLCEEWSAASGLRHAKKYLGAAGWGEWCVSGLSKLPTLVFTAGVHPHDAKSCDQDTIGRLRDLAKHPQCCAIGECGLDYDRMFTPREVQLIWFRQQVELAVELDMPLFLHERDAGRGPALGSSRELLEVLAECGVEPSRVCIHCYTGNKQNLQAYLSRGYFIGLTGFAGMKQRGFHIRAMLQKGVLPLQQLMIETDCPFMMPDKEYLPVELGLQGRRMEPCGMPAVCRAVAECLGVDPADVARITTANATRFFGL